MDVQLPNGCGNAPRVGIVNDLVTHWAAADTDSLTPWLAPSGITWFVNGTEIIVTAANSATVCPADTPVGLEIRSTITHGKTAACEGTLHTDTTPIDFCHVITFTGAGKTAKVAGIRSFWTADLSG